MNSITMNSFTDYRIYRVHITEQRVAGLEPKYEQYHRVYNTENRVAGPEPKYEQYHRLQNIEWLELNLNMNSFTDYRI